MQKNEKSNYVLLKKLAFYTLFYIMYRMITH